MPAWSLCRLGGRCLCLRLPLLGSFQEQQSPLVSTFRIVARLLLSVLQDYLCHSGAGMPEADPGLFDKSPNTMMYTAHILSTIYERPFHEGAQQQHVGPGY